VKRAISHVSGALLEGALVATLIVVVAAGTTFAAKGGKPTGSGTNGGTVALVMVDDRNGDGAADHGDTVTFVASTSATPEPHVRLQCTQDGAVVYTHEAGMYPTYPWPWEQDMTLSSSAWPSGAAACKAQLFYYSRNKIVWGTTLAFAVGA
jgi:hypothetical protein